MKTSFKKPILFLLIACFTVGSGYLVWSNFIRIPHPRFYANISAALSDTIDSDGFQKAERITQFRFPEDFGPHPGFQTEWWYYTGNLSSSQGEKFGYQFTVFRRSLSPNNAKTGSEWRTNQVYFAHFAVTDVLNEKFHSFERFSRDSLGLAGAKSVPYQVWINDWKISGTPNKPTIFAEEDAIGIELNLQSSKPIVLQGNKGLSQKGPKKGNASYYFSQTRLKTEGNIKIKDKTYQVEGFSWLDREWSTSTLDKDDIGWDWFSIQLDDSREIMLFHIRTRSGGISPFSSGSYVESDGTKHALAKDDFTLSVTQTWKSKHTGIEYPSSWRIKIDRFDLELTVTPLLKDQEHRHSFVYWEGAIKAQSEKAQGTGYVELTGYEKE
mgnify:CR=1 FL=1